MAFSTFVAVDETNNFPQPVRQAMANSAEVKALLDAKNPLTYKGYRAFTNTDDPTKYPLGISNALLGTNDGFNWSNGESFMNVITFRNSVYTGGTSQLAFPYADDTRPPQWRVWKNGATGWGAWQTVASVAALNAALADAVLKWKPATSYASGQQVVTPNNEIVSSKSARTSGATWNSTEAANWTGVRDRILQFTNGGFAWSSGASWDAGALSLDASASASSQVSPNAAFAIPGSLSGSIKFVEPGLYDLIWYNQPSGESGNAGYRVVASGTWPGPIAGADATFGEGVHINGQSYWETRINAIGIRVPQANLEVRCVGSQTNGNTVTPRVKVIQRERWI